MSNSVPAGAPAKICIRCGRDCANRPRTKDQLGRYTCRECLEKAQKQAAAPAHAMRAPASPTPPADNGPIPLADEAGAGGEGDLMAALLADAVKEQAKVTVRPCPNCGNPLRQDAALCLSCGFNPRTGQVMTTKMAKAETVPDDPYAAAKEKARRQATKLAVHEYVKPALMTVCGVAIAAALYGRTGGSEQVIGYLIGYIISASLAVLAFWLCGLLWLGFDAPISLTALRLLGIAAVAGAARATMWSVFPFFRLPFLVYIIFYIGLMASLFDMDLEDTILVTIITLAVNFFVGVAVMLAVIGMLSNGG